MKILKKLFIIAVFIGLTAPTVYANHETRALRFLHYAERDLNYLDSRMEIGDGIFNQLDKAKEYIRNGDYDKAAVMIKVAKNALSGRLNGVLNKTFKNSKERKRLRAYILRAIRDLSYAERYL